MKPHFRAALPLIALAIAATIAPPTTVTPSQWAAEHMIEVEGPRAGQLWDPALTPYIPPVIDTAMTGSHPVTIVRKSAQTGYTRGLVAICGWIVAESPARTLLALPTTGAALDFNREKLAPTIEATRVLARRVFPPSRRGVNGSSAQYKGFPNGSIAIVGSNSAPDLRARVFQYALCDEVDEYPRDLAGQGSAMSMIDGRQVAFHSTANYKKVMGGTPTNKGSSLIEDAFQKSDRRFWTMPCVHCKTPIRFTFGGYVDEANVTGLRFNRRPPFEAHYVAQCCGGIIEHWQKADMVRSGQFVAENPLPGIPAGFHFDALTSLLTTWDKIAEAYVDAGDDPYKLKTFTNLWLGLPYEEKTDVPDYKALMMRRESYPERVIPADCLHVFMGCDVQKRGLYVSISGWTPDRRSKTLFAEYIQAGTPTNPGDTVDPEDPCWRRLAEIFETPLPIEGLPARARIDALGIDCRYNAPVVYDFVRRHHGAFAMRTIDGWGVPPMGGMKLVDYDWRGKLIKRGAALWTVGSYNLKSMFYAYAMRDITLVDGVPTAPAGYCHFGDFLGEAYFRQMCSEYVGLDKAGRRVWKTSAEDNHWLDCRILEMALAFGSQFDIRNRNEAYWRERAMARGLTPDLIDRALDPIIHRAPVAPREEPAKVAAETTAAIHSRHASRDDDFFAEEWI